MSAPTTSDRIATLRLSVEAMASFINRRTPLDPEARLIVIAARAILENDEAAELAAMAQDAAS